MGIILIVIALGVFGFLEWAIWSLSFFFIDAILLSWWIPIWGGKHPITNDCTTGIITDYISIDISLVWFAYLMAQKIILQFNIKK